MVKRLTGKRGKIYRQLLKEGKTEAYARRISKRLSEGKSLSEARGHKEERLRVRKRGRVGVRVPKSRLEKKKAEWAAYTYQDMLASGKKMDSPFSMSSYDHTKTAFKNYDSIELFTMHQYMEREVEKYLKWYIELASKNDMYVDFSEDNHYQHRQFEWKLFDEEGELRYWLVYENGNIIMRQMWEDFDSVQFKLEIREQRVWE